MNSVPSPPPNPFIKRLGLGRWLYRNVHGPLRNIKWKLKFGLTGAIRYQLGEAAMARAAQRLSEIDAQAPEAFACTYMTGRRYWHQTLFCAHSLARQFDRRLRVTILDDGSLTPDQTNTLRRVLKGVRLITPAETNSRLDQALPRKDFPKLRAMRDSMPMMRKLVDLRAGGTEWQLYLDSDMLFFGKPDFLVRCQNHRAACHMHDRIHAYVLSEADILQHTGSPIRSRVNAGIVGLDDKRLDWSQVERWLHALPPKAFDPQLLEQTLTAMLLAGHEAVATPDEQYHILYNSTDPAPPNVRLLHYIYQAKLRYFSRDWRPFAHSDK